MSNKITSITVRTSTVPSGRATHIPSIVVRTLESRGCVQPHLIAAVLFWQCGADWGDVLAYAQEVNAHTLNAAGQIMGDALALFP